MGALMTGRHRAAGSSHRHAMVRTLAVAATVLAVAATVPPILVTGTPSAATLPLCQGRYEDGSPLASADLEPDGVISGLPCYWDAATLGNRQGTSFIMWTAS